MRCSARPSERYGDVELSVQASRFHASDPRNGCGHTPLELYDSVEVALRRVDGKSRHRWIRQPSREIGIDGFDDLWLDPEDVPIAEYVPKDRIEALRTALVERARGHGGGPAVKRDIVPDPPLVVEEVEVEAIDVAPPVAGAGREPMR